MAQKVDDDGNVINVSKRKVKSQLKDTVKQAAQSVDTKQVTDAAKTAVTDVANSIETKVGGIAGEIDGGVKSITEKFDKFQDKLNNVTTEGLIDDGIDSLKNMGMDMVEDAVSGLISKIGLGASENRNTKPPAAELPSPAAPR